MSKFQIYFFYFASGLSALLFEIIAIRELTLVFGGTIFSTAIILSAYMAGMGLGAFYFGRKADAVSNPLVLYSYTVAGVAVISLVFPALVAFVNFIYQGLGFEFYILKIVFNFLLLLIPTSLFGAAFPLLMKSLQMSQSSVPLSKIGKDLSVLYTVYNIGAVLGAILCGFFMLRFLGARNSLYINAGLNIFLFVWIFLQIRAGKQAGSPAVYSEINQAESQDFKYKRLVLLFSFAAGFAAFGYEILWARSLSFLIGNVSYAITLMIAAFISGMTLGAFLYYLLLQNKSEQGLLKIMGLLNLFIFLWILISIKFIGGVYDFGNTIYNELYDIWGANPYTLNAFRYLSSSLLVFLPGVCFGISFIILNKLYNKRIKILGSGVGLVSSINSIGCICGSLFATFVLINLLGIAGGFTFLAAINLIIGVVFLLLSGIKLSVAIPTTAVSAIIFFFLLPEFQVGKYINYISREKGELLYYKESIYGTVNVFKRNDETLILSINGTGEVPTDYNSLLTFKLLGHLGFIINPDAQNILVNALGGGVALGSVALHDKPVDCVEICGDVRNAARIFKEFNNDVLSRPNVNIVINDGRNYIKQVKKKYDIITADATHPGSGESWPLFTREFYQDSYAALNEKGMMIQWLPMHHIATGDYATVLATFNSVFKNSLVFYFNDYTVIVGSKHKLDLNCKKIDSNFARLNQNAKSDLAKLGFTTGMDFFRYLTLGFDGTKKLAESGKIATDDLSHLEFAEMNQVGIATDTKNLIRIFEHFNKYGIKEIQDSWITPECDEEYKDRKNKLHTYMNVRLTVRTKPLQDTISVIESLGDSNQELLSDPSIKQIRENTLSYLESFFATEFAKVYSKYSADDLKKFYEKSHKWFPENPAIAMFLGVIYSESGKSEEGIQLVEFAVKKEPENEGYLVNLGYIYYVNKQLEKADSIYNRVLQLNPSNETARRYFKERLR